MTETVVIGHFKDAETQIKHVNSESIVLCNHTIPHMKENINSNNYSQQLYILWPINNQNIWVKEIMQQVPLIVLFFSVCIFLTLYLINFFK